MKKIITYQSIFLFSFLGLVNNAKSQTYAFSPGKTFIVNQGLNDLWYGGIEWTNNSAQTLVLHWQKIKVDTMGGSYFDMCASGNCYLGIPDSGSYNVYPTLPGQIGWLKMHFWSGSVPAICVAKIYVYEASFPNSGDTLTFILNVNQANGISQNDSDEKFDVYPNPANENLIIDFTNNNFEQPIELSIINSLGQSVYLKKFNSFSKNNIDVSALANGVYIIQLMNDKKEFLQTKKIIINHK